MCVHYTVDWVAGVGSTAPINTKLTPFAVAFLTVAAIGMGGTINQSYVVTRLGPISYALHSIPLHWTALHHKERGEA